MLGALRSRIGSALDRRIIAINSRVESVGGEVLAVTDDVRAVADQTHGIAGNVGRLEQTVTALAAELHALRAEHQQLRDEHVRCEAALRWIAQDHAEHRRLLRAARARPSYAAVFDDPAPLISVVIPTYDHTELLVERSLPSVLNQTHERLEIIVVGDAVPDSVGEAVAALSDPRVRFVNLPYRVASDDRVRTWLAASVPARRAGRDLASGSWLVDFDDDDALRPRALERGLELARKGRFEFVYGPCEQHLPDGTVHELSAYPPVLGKLPVQGALLHRDLRFFERSQVSAEFGAPNDWFFAESMLRAGVRFGMQEDVVLDYYPSMRATGG